MLRRRELFDRQPASQRAVWALLLPHWARLVELESDPGSTQSSGTVTAQRIAAAVLGSLHADPSPSLEDVSTSIVSYSL